jgi:hypothetical protein
MPAGSTTLATIPYLRKRVPLQAARNPRKVSTQNVNGDSGNHEDRANPEAPVIMHTPPVWAGVRLATIAAISFMIVFASGHHFSISIKSAQC